MLDQAPPKEVSENILNAISGALKEEKIPVRIRRIKTLAASLLCTGVLAAPLLLMFKENINTAWIIALGIWWLCLLAGFHLYYTPQPRLAVPGYWSPWVFARLLILMTFLTVGQILICPSFVFLESPLHFTPFESLTRLFMSLGGMRACMFFCGLIFTSIGGLLTFLTVSRVMKRSSGASLLNAVGVAYFTQLPVIGIQIWDEDLRPYVLFWILGGLIGAALMSLLVRGLQAR